MKIHDLKCWPEYFEPVQDGRKRFEIRLNDRDYKVGDVLRLREFDPKMTTERGEPFTGREYTVIVIFMVDFPAGLRDGYVCMTIEPCVTL